MTRVVISGSGCVTSAGLSPAELFDTAARGENGLNADGETGLTLGFISDRATCELRDRISDAFLPENQDREKPYLYLYASLEQAMKVAGWDCVPEATGLIFATTTGYVPYWERDLVNYGNGKISQEQFDQSFRDHPLSRPLKPLLSGGLKGPVRILTSACAAGTQALALAHDWIARGKIERCIVAGTELLSKLTIRGFSSLSLISKRQCAPFDENRDGINLSEGAGVLLLEAAHCARASLATLSGGGISLDSFDMTSPDPSGDGIARAAAKALRRAGVAPGEISWIHAHGTGSQVNDLAEAAAAARVFEGQPPPMSSTKGIHGHALAASGIIESILCMEAMKHNLMLGTAGHTSVDKKILIPIQRENTPQELHHILKTTLGFGGVNAAIVLSRSMGGAH